MMSEETTSTQEKGAQTAAPQSGGEDQGQRRFVRDKDAAMAAGGEGRFKGRRQRRKVSYLTINKIANVDYREVNILRRFINEHGRILPSRQTGNTAKQQRMIAAAIRKAREMALLPYVVNEPSADRPPRPRREYGSYTPRTETPPQEDGE